MDEGLKDWIELERHATETMRRGSVPDSAGTLRLFQLLVLPSFDPAIGWEVFQRTSPSKPVTFYGTRSIWRRDLDSEKFRNPLERLKYPRTLHPTIEANVVELLPTLVESILNRFRLLTISVSVESGSIYLDGTRYEVSFEAGFQGARYYWSNDGPPEWKQLTDAAIASYLKLERERVYDF